MLYQYSSVHLIRLNIIWCENHVETIIPPNTDIPELWHFLSYRSYAIAIFGNLVYISEWGGHPPAICFLARSTAVVITNEARCRVNQVAAFLLAWQTIACKYNVYIHANILCGAGMWLIKNMNHITKQHDNHNHVKYFTLHLDVMNTCRSGQNGIYFITYLLKEG